MRGSTTCSPAMEAPDENRTPRGVPRQAHISGHRDPITITAAVDLWLRAARRPSSERALDRAQEALNALGLNPDQMLPEGSASLGEEMWAKAGGRIEA